jgi:hypothetical protein
MAQESTSPFASFLNIKEATLHQSNDAFQRGHLAQRETGLSRLGHNCNLLQRVCSLRS